MGRVDRLPEDNLVRRVHALRIALNELKTSQRLGSDSVLTSRIFSTNTYDIQVSSLTQLTGYTVEVTFTPASNAFENLGQVYKMETVMTASDNQVNMSIERQKPSTNQQKWRIYLSTSAVTTTYVRLKFYFFSNGAGTFTTALV